MPVRLDDPNNTQGRTLDGVLNSEDDLEYKYPEGLDLHPDSEQHKQLLDKLMVFANEAAKDITQRHDEWRKIDSTLTAYVPENVKNEARKKGDKTMPAVLPSSYTILETLLSYMVATFLQDPVFTYNPTGPEDSSGAALLEMTIQNQVLKAKMGLNFHTQWRDAFAYGLGVITTYWNTLRGVRRVAETVINPDTKLEEVIIKKEDTILYEGNYLTNIDPFLYLPDPTVAAQDIQRGRYVGWASRDNKLALLSEEEEDNSNLFNVGYLRFISGQSKFMVANRDRNDTATGNTRQTYRTDMDSPVDLVTMYVTLIPEDWELGESTKPEKWCFVWAGDQIILAAQPMILDHNMYPVSVAAPDFDGYSATPISRLEITLPLQEIMDFLFNSRIANVRKAVNDTLIVDPSMVNMNDLRSPEPGKIVRTRRSMWGKGVTGIVEQLKIVDITKGNVADIALLLNQMKETTSAVDVIAGNIRTGGERRSATESRDARTGALAKLNKTARMIAMQSMVDIGTMLASQTQQLMKEDVQVKITGRWAEDLAEEYGESATVSIMDILVMTDVTIGSGNIPGGESPDLWIQLMQAFANNPEVMQRIDMSRVFMHIARQLGANNITDFLKPVEQQAIPQQVDVGEIASVEGGV